jgi:hypothetical protein
MSIEHYDDMPNFEVDDEWMAGYINCDNGRFEDQNDAHDRFEEDSRKLIATKRRKQKTTNSPTGEGKV